MTHQKYDWLHIKKAEQWLRDNPKHPRFEEALERYEGLCEKYEKEWIELFIEDKVPHSYFEKIVMRHDEQVGNLTKPR